MPTADAPDLEVVGEGNRPGAAAGLRLEWLGLGAIGGVEDGAVIRASLPRAELESQVPLSVGAAQQMSALGARVGSHVPELLAGLPWER